MVRARAGSRGGERGSATLELTIVFPALLLVMAGVVQAGLWFYAREVLLAAAEEGARVASVEGGTADRGRETAAEFVDRTASNLVDHVSVTGRRSTSLATVTVFGRSLSLIPGVDGFAIEQTAAYPVERITAP